MVISAMTYKGYGARVEYDPRDEIFVGRIIGIVDAIGFHDTSVKTLTTDFHARQSLRRRLQGGGTHPAEAVFGQLDAALFAGDSRPHRGASSHARQGHRRVGGEGS